MNPINKVGIRGIRTEAFERQDDTASDEARERQNRDTFL